MNSEIKTKQIELIPDKDGFLFEIEDYNYLLNRVCGWVASILAISFVLFYLFGGDILSMRNDGHRGYLLVTVGGTYIVFEAIKLLIYLRKEKKETLMFYTDYIYRTNNNLKIPLENIEEGYIAKYNTFSNKIPWRISSLATIVAFLLGGGIALFLFLIGSFFYSIFISKKYTIEINNLILLQNKYNRYCVSVSLNIASKEDIEKLNLYLNQYLDTDINKMEKILYKIPEFKRNNL